jgi:hypothetical protein
MSKLGDYIRFIQATEEDRAILIYGSQYRLWFEGDYIGTATWVRDEEIGDSFQNQVEMNGQLLQFIYVADQYELVFDTRKQKPSN